VLGRDRRFRDLVERQLNLFAADHERELDELATARDRYDRSPREGAEEAFGDLQDQVDWLSEPLVEVCERYASTLDEEATDRYAEVFVTRVRSRFPLLADAVSDALRPV
jgi:hypothetical protein